MPGPQTEDGFLKIATEIVDALAHIRISGEEYQCLWVIIRKTYGWNKKEDEIALSQFTLITGLSKSSVIRAIKKLSDKNIIVYKKVNYRTNKYRFNKHFKKWKPLTKKSTIHKDVNHCLQKSKSSFTKKRHTIDTITIDTITKDKETALKEDLMLHACSVLDYLNDITSKGFKSRRSGKITASLQIIIDRLKEGYTMAECKTVIDNKWADKFYQENKGFMCPQTLFIKSKFDAKLNDTPREQLPINRRNELPGRFDGDFNPI